MKKALIIFVCLFICGCQSTQKTSQESYVLLGNYAVSDKGVYSFDRNRMLVYYYDIETNKEIPLCNKTVCNHDNDDCIAYSLSHYKNGTVLGSQPMYYDNSLYLFYEKYDSENYLCKAKTDGSDRQQIAKIDNDIPWAVQNLLLYKDKAFFTADLIQEDDKSETGLRNELVSKSVDLNSGELKDINIDKNLKNYYNLIGAYNGNIYFSNINEDKSQNIYEYNIEKEKGNILIENASNEILKSFVYNGHLYYLDLKNKGIYDYDIDSHKVTKLSDIKDIDNFDNIVYQNIGGSIIMLYEKDNDKIIHLQYYDCIKQKYINTQDNIVASFNEKYLVEEYNGKEKQFQLNEYGYKK